ncbi:MAG: TadE/TadG family type IV pilus assembly protein [Acidimicrobiia bacterium]
MVEFAIVLPLLLVLVLGIVEFGRAYSLKTSLQAAALEGARELALGEDASEVEAAVTGATPYDGLTISQVPCPDEGEDDAEVTVVREFTFLPALGNVLSILPGGGGSGSFGTIDISATGVMRCGL